MVDGRDVVTLQARVDDTGGRPQRATNEQCDIPSACVTDIHMYPSLPLSPVLVR